MSKAFGRVMIQGAAKSGLPQPTCNSCQHISKKGLRSHATVSEMELISVMLWKSLPRS